MPDGRSGAGAEGCGAAGAAPQPSPGIRATRGRPARSVSTVHVQPGRRSATQSTIACPWSAPISSSATPPPASATGNRSTSRPMTASPSGPPSRARLGSNVVARGSVGHRVVADVGQVGQHEVEALAGRPVRQQVGDARSRSGRRRRGRRRSRARDRAHPGRCRRRGSRPPRAPGACGARRPARPRSRRSPSRRPRSGAARRSSRRGSGHPAGAWSRPARARPGAPSPAAGSAPAGPPRTRARRTP